MNDYQKFGNLFVDLMSNTPIYKFQDQVFGWWFDQCMLAFIKSYYWPAFIAGSSDNIVDLFKPQTYSICKV
jgi:hypothetical protein